MKSLLLPVLFLAPCACTPSLTKPTASVTGANQSVEAANEDERQVVHGLAPR
jgi:hypothetical protein